MWAFLLFSFLIIRVTLKIFFAWNFAVLIFSAIVINILISSNSYAACAKDANGAIKIETGDGTPFADTSTPTTYDQDACQEEPDEYKLTFYKVALCTEANDPYTNGASPDYSGCVDILNEEKEFNCDVPSGHNSFIYLLKGELNTGGWTIQSEIINFESTFL